MLVGLNTDSQVLVGLNTHTIPSSPKTSRCHKTEIDITDVVFLLS